MSLDNNLSRTQRCTVNVIGNARDSFTTETQQPKAFNNGSDPHSSAVSVREAPGIGLGTISSSQNEALEVKGELHTVGAHQVGANGATIRTIV